MKPKVYDVETVVIALHEYIDEVADLDDLAELASKIIYNDPIVVTGNESHIEGDGARSCVYRNGKKVGK